MRTAEDVPNVIREPNAASVTGEPGDAKVSRPVRRGADGKGLGKDLAGGLPYVFVLRRAAPFAETDALAVTRSHEPSH
jgi:hypothetical protein